MSGVAACLLLLRLLAAQAACSLAGGSKLGAGSQPGDALVGHSERRSLSAQGTGKSASLAGRVHIRLAGRSGCRERGYLGPQPCAAGPRGLALKATGGGPFATFVLEESQPGAGEYTIRSLGRAGPPFTACASYLSSNGPACTNVTVFMSSTAQRWKLVPVAGKRDTYLIRPAVNMAFCPWQFLGALKPRPGGPGDCGFAAVGLYERLDGKALIEWQLVVGTNDTGFWLTPYTQMAAPGNPDAVAFLFTAPSTDAASPGGCSAVLRSIKFLVCSESVGAVAMGLSLCPLDGDGNPNLSAAVASAGLDYVNSNVCSSGSVTVWTFTGSTALTPGSPYAFVLSSRVPTSGTPVPWRWVDSPGDAAPIPPGLPIGYKETSGGVWTAHTPNNWVELKFF
ncbi:hypothetical protein ABPG77_000575 [Micractinium sp. CCAP 211/92]